MLYIHSDKIDTLAGEWYTLLAAFLKARNYKRKMIRAISFSKLSIKDKAIAKGLIECYYIHLKEYALADEQELLFRHSLYQQTILGKHKSRYKKIHKKLATIFYNLYTEFTKYKPEKLDHPIAYHFFYALNIRTCPYCNRNYTFTIYDKIGKKTHPEYDHFYDKASNPLLAVSFFNLIPSCHVCNHVKHNDSIRINPYFHGFKGKFKVSDDGIFRGFQTKSKAEELDYKTFGLDQLYQLHDDYVQELIEKARIYRGPMMDALSSTFQTPDYTPKDVFNFVWGKNLDTANHINRPLSKLTRDILEELDIPVDDIDNNV